MGVSMTTVAAIRTLKHEIIHLREVDLIRLSDEEIVLKAANEKRIVLTMDLDFGQIIALTRRSVPSTILFRMRNQSPSAVTPRLLRVLEECQLPLESGAFITVEDQGYRVRPLPLR
jgi:predicted nuclease of predicted toxin-antitoxin system